MLIDVIDLAHLMMPVLRQMNSTDRQKAADDKDHNPDYAEQAWFWVGPILVSFSKPTTFVTCVARLAGRALGERAGEADASRRRTSTAPDNTARAVAGCEYRGQAGR